MNLSNILFIDRFPKIDLHGLDRDTAIVYINDFIKDNLIMKNEIIVIVHGNGEGIIRKCCYDILNKSKKVADFKGVVGNNGCTIVRLKFD